jgi:transposase-like protein
MAGRPVLAEVNRKLREEMGGEEFVFNALANGETVGQVARKLGISRRYLYYWRDEKGERERRAPLWAEAILLAGGAHAERGLEGLEALERVKDLTAPQVSLASALARHRSWLAGKLDPEGFGDRNEISFSFGDLHLQVIQQGRAAREALPAPEEIPEAVIVEAEVIGETEDELCDLY